MEIRKNSKNFTRELSLYFQGIDVSLFATVVAVSLFGLINMYGIVGTESAFLGKHLFFVLTGIGLMVFFSFFNYRYLKNYSIPVLIVYLGSVILLILPFFSESIRGVRSWIVFGGYTFEPVELVKLVLIILMAKYFSRRHVHINQFKHIFVSGIYFIIPLIIVLIQPDLGSAVILLLIWGGILIASGMNKKHLFALIVFSLIFAFIGWLVALRPYQKDRILSFLNPYSDPQGTGYNLIQSKIAIGSGGWFGNGLGQGLQTKLGFLPEPHNDFVFAATADQFGFVGIALLLAAILFIISRIIHIGLRSNSNFGKLFSVGLAILIFSHAFIESGVSVGILPVTGIPFPFISYGGSNMISLMIGLGILQSIRKYG